MADIKDKLIELKCYVNNSTFFSKKELEKYLISGDESEIVVNFLTSIHRMINSMIEEEYENRFKLFEIAPYKLHAREVKECLEKMAHNQPMKSMLSGISSESKTNTRKQSKTSSLRRFAKRVLLMLARKL